MQLMGQYLSATDRNQLFLSDNGGVYMWLADGGSSDWYGDTGYQFAPNVWYHVAASRASGTLRVFINGTELFNASSSLDTNFSAPFEIGRKGDDSLYTNGKMDQIRISDNARYTANFTAPTTPFETDANTKLLIQSDWSEGGIGADHSGNYNYFTPANMGVDSSTKDTPLTNFCTVNPLTFPRQGDTTSLWGRATEGNLRWTSAGSSWGGHCFFGGTFNIAPNTGKYYWEMLDIGNKLSLIHI